MSKVGISARVPMHFRLTPLAAGLALLGAMGTAHGGPDGGTVKAGSATISQSGSKTTITQQSQRAVIDWRSFNIGQNEWVDFQQLGANAAVLNRVLGDDPSAILGRLSANGQVFLVNPNGVLFGRGAQVNVGGLVASTANVATSDFMAGRLRFDQPGKPGAAVVNEGKITAAEGGLVALVAPHVVNSGTIEARLGKVSLAGGDAFVIDLYGDQLVNLVVDRATMDAVTDAQGRPLSARVDHSGAIVAEGGRVQLSAAMARRLVDNVINVTGIVKATSAEARNGVISLLGDSQTHVTVGGSLVASGETGGRIEVTGGEVTVANGARIDASGQQAGGRIAVGGEWQGGGSLAHASVVDVQSGASIMANGGQVGGTVVLWSDRQTNFNGSIEARGALAGGNVEVSSKGSLGFLGDVDVASSIKGGNLLLDPTNLTIAATSSGDSQVAASQINSLLQRGTSVSLTATENIAVNAEVNGLGGLAGGGLTLTAGSNLNVNQTIALNNGALNLTATNGSLTAASNATLYTGAGAINLSGGAGVDVGQLLTSGAVRLESRSGGVTVRNPVLAAATAPGVAAPATSLSIGAAGAVQLAGALVGAGGVRVEGPAGATTATSLSLLGPIDSVGPVNVSTSGNITTQAPIIASSGVSLTAGGALTVGRETGGQDDGIWVRSGTGGITLAATGDLRLNGDLKTAGGNIDLRSSGGGVTAKVTTPGGAPIAGDAAIVAGTQDTGNYVLVRASGDVQLGEVQAADRLDVQTAGNVLLLKQLGGAPTGYTTYDVGYDSNNRPLLGRLIVSAGQSVELNGLNLDGNASEAAITPGLSVSAGRSILSNDTIAVNKGDILLAAGTTQVSDGVYLGSSVFSRGWDPADHSAKVGYSITISGRNLGLFDNTSAIAELPGLYLVRLLQDGIPTGQTVYADAQGYVVDVNGNRLPGPAGSLQVVTCANCPPDFSQFTQVTSATVVVADDSAGPGSFVPVLGQPVARTIAKIEIANNAANYTSREDLVPAINAGAKKVTVAVTSIGGLANVGSTRQDLSTFDWSLTALSNTPSSAPGPSTASSVSSTRGILLKLLGFASTSDIDTEVWGQAVAFTTVPAGAELSPTTFFGANPAFRPTEDIAVDPPTNGLFELRLSNQPMIGPAGATCDSCVATYVMQRRDGVLAGFADIVAIKASSPAQPGTYFAGDWRPDPNSTSLPAVGSTVQLKLAQFVASRGGTAGGVDLGGTLVTAATSTPVPSPSNLVPLLPSEFAPLTRGYSTPRFIQSGSGAIVGASGVGGQNAGPRQPVGFDVSRYVVESRETPGLAGVRVQVFDGAMANQIGRVTADASGGSNIVPGITGLVPNNFSGTSFASIGAPLAAVTTSSPLAPPPVVAASGVDEAARIAQGTPASQTAELEGDDAILARPASQADLGRAGAIAGGGNNVFSQSLTLIRTSDPTLCALSTSAKAALGRSRDRNQVVNCRR